MAEENKSNAKSELGQLFVDIGIPGLGNLIKGLNTVSATFMLTTKAAQQFAKPIIDISKQSMNTAVGVGKMGASLGTTAVEAYKLNTYFEQFNLSGLENDLGSLSKKFTDIKMGISGVSGDMAYAFNQLGLDWSEYDGSLESMLQLVRDVKAAVKDLDPVEARSYLEKIGFNNEWLYAFQRADFNLDDAMSISDNTIQSLIDLEERFNRLNIAKKRVEMQAAATIADNGGLDVVQTGADILEDLGTKDGQDRLKKTAKKVFDNKNPYNINKPLGNAHPILDSAINTLKMNPLTAPFGNVLGGGLSYYNTYRNNKSPESHSAINNTPAQNTSINNPVISNKGYDLQEIDDPELYTKAPPALSEDRETLTQPPTQNISYNINIENTNKITGNNPTEIANKIAAISTDDIKYSQYQVHNLPNV